MSEEDSQDPLSSRSAATPYIESSGAEIDAVFAGNLSANLKRVEEVFGVSLITRDSWIKVEADDPETVKRVKSFLEHLFRLHADMRTPLRQMDFDLALKSYSSGSPAELSSFFASKIRISRKRQEIVPRTRNQLAYVDAMNKHDIVFALGPAGTGKTYLAVAMAVNALMTGKRDRIILARPAVEAGENLGFLPGKLEDKINPYLRPLHDALREMIEPQELATLTERGMIELAPLAFMRGRTLNNSFIILDEAQNTTDDQMLMFLTRLGFNSQCVVAGDPSQTDLPSRKSSGLAKAIRLLSKIDGIRVCRFDRGDVMRHSLVERIVNAYEQAAHAPSEDSEG
ncbi:MAG: PhoH family protein [Victivallales bacterium]|jgi:phoH family protein